MIAAIQQNALFSCFLIALKPFDHLFSLFDGAPSAGVGNRNFVFFADGLKQRSQVYFFHQHQDEIFLPLPKTLRIIVTMGMLDAFQNALCILFRRLFIEIVLLAMKPIRFIFCNPVLRNTALNLP